MMWHAIVLGTYSASLFVLWRHMVAFRDFPTTFVLLAIWSRYLLAGLHEYTYPPLFAGLSPIALHSVFIAASGVFLVPFQMYLRPFLFVFYALIFLIVFTGVLHAQFTGMIDLLIRWVFFIAIALLLFRAMTKFGVDNILRTVLVIAITPLTLQFIGVFLGVRVLDQDGNWAYTAGYFHGGLFSQMILTCLFASILIKWRQGWIPLVFTLFCTIGVTFANYRTSIIASVPVVMTHLATMTTQSAMVLLRPIIVLFVIIGIIILAVIFSNNMPERFSAIPYVIMNWQTLIQPPHDYTLEERDLLTGRVFTWAHYVYAWYSGSSINHLLGFGPGAYKGVMPKDAHNDLISFLFEFGMMGVFIFFSIFISQSYFAMRVGNVALAVRLLSCIAGYFIINMATGGMGGIEALILFAVISATIWAHAEREAVRRATDLAKSSSKGLGARWQSFPPVDGAKAGASRFERYQRARGSGTSASTRRPRREGAGRDRGGAPRPLRLP